MQSFKRLFSISLLSVICNANCMEINVIQSDKAEEFVWQRLKDLFVITFDQSYKHVDIKDINNTFNSTSDYLQNLFDVDRKSTENLNFDFIFATEKQEVLGYILCCYSAEDKKAYIHHLVVDTTKHNKGIGKSLIKACEDLYKEADFISLSTRRFNDKAIGFYKHIGFYETNLAPDIAYVIRPLAKNNPQIVNLEKVVTRKIKMVCESERLELRYFTMNDVDALESVLGDEEVMRQSVARSLSGPLSKDQIKEYVCNKLLKSYQEYGWGRYAILKKDDGAFIGYCGLSMQDIGDGKHYIELGYRLAKKYWGNGYATEAACAVRDYARDVLGLSEIISIIHPINTASINVARKTGLKLWKEGAYHGYPINVYKITLL